MKQTIKKIFPFFIPIYQKIREWYKSNKNEKDIFTEIYNKNLWKDSDSASGTGSNISATEEIRASLPEIWKTYSVQTFVDAPCGDFFWMQKLDTSSIKYIGADIVEEIIHDNNTKFSNKGEFRVLNLISDPLPDSDMLMCRECLVHLNFEQIHDVIRNLKRSSTKYLLATTYPDVVENIDIITGQWRPLDMTLPPFNFPEPVEIFNDSDTEKTKYSKKIAIWDISKI